jgi:hypothetical protein
MVDRAGIMEHMDVVGSDGEHIGVVDGVDGDEIKLAKSDPAGGTEHHLIPLVWVEEVGDDGRVHLSVSSGHARLKRQVA